MTTLTLSIDGMTCGHCVANVRRALESLPDVHVQDVRIGSAQLHVANASSTTLRPILAALAEAGYPASVQTPGATTAATAPAASPKSGCGCGCGTTDTATTPLTRVHA
jgi:copper chaperone